MANETRLIDANALVKKILSLTLTVTGLRAGKGVLLELLTKYREGILQVVKEQPTVDAVEVVHGRWIFKHNPITDPKGYFIRIVCSECNLHTGQKSNYCPQCGAKMDGGNEDGS